MSEHGKYTMTPVGTKGYTGNPGGRPKMPEELKRAFQEATPVALATLLQIAQEGENEGARVRASEALLDRAWGKPVQQVEADVHDSRPTVDTSKLTPDQKAVLAALAVESIGG